MTIKKLEAVLEGILFAMGRAVPIRQLANAIEQDENTTKKLLHNLRDRLDKEESGIRIIELNGSYQMCTNPDVFEALIQVVKQPKKQVLTNVQVETLAIIAYKQPITRQEIESIRGVKCDHAINKLIEYNLIEEVGRLDAIGRPLLFGTTEEFLRSFGVTSMEDLPVINPVKVENLRQEAEEEVQLSLNLHNDNAEVKS